MAEICGPSFRPPGREGDSLSQSRRRRLASLAFRLLPSFRMLHAIVLCSTGAAAFQHPLSLQRSEPVSRRAAVLGALPLLMTPLAVRADEVLHIVDYPKKGSCGEALIPDKALPFVKTFGGFSSGSCASVGYGTKEGTESGTGDKDRDRTYDIYSKDD